jgi:hypothetical protein
MHMIPNATDAMAFTIAMPCNCREIGVEARTDLRI